MKASLALSKMTGIAFTTCPAATVEEFDKIILMMGRPSGSPLHMGLGVGVWGRGQGPTALGPLPQCFNPFGRVAAGHPPKKCYNI